MKKAIEPVWITEDEAVRLTGLASARQLRYYIKTKVFDIGCAQLTSKSERKYNKLDIDRLLLESAAKVA